MDTAPPLPRPPDKDDEQLKILVILHFIMAALTFAGLLFIVAHYFVMLTILNASESTPNPVSDADLSPLPAEVQQVLEIFYLIIGLGLLAATLLNVFSAIFMRRRRRRLFSLITAGLNGIQFPFGTALGIFTIIVLCRDSVRFKYEQHEDLPD
jgi:hypothetical protein